MVRTHTNFRTHPFSGAVFSWCRAFCFLLRREPWSSGYDGKKKENASITTRTRHVYYASTCIYNLDCKFSNASLTYCCFCLHTDTFSMWLVSFLRQGNVGEWILKRQRKTTAVKAHAARAPNYARILSYRRAFACLIPIILLVPDCVLEYWLKWITLFLLFRALSLYVLGL